MTLQPKQVIIEQARKQLLEGNFAEVYKTLAKLNPGIVTPEGLRTGFQLAASLEGCSVYALLRQALEPHPQ